MKAKITKRLVDGLKPGPADRTIFDSDVPASPFGSAKPAACPTRSNTKLAVGAARRRGG